MGSVFVRMRLCIIVARWYYIGRLHSDMEVSDMSAVSAPDRQER
jgi:hypothetical protein